MSSGKVHATASLVLAAGFSMGALVSQEPRILECTVGALVGIFVTPDLDLNSLGIVQGKFIRQRVGWFVERLWRWFWRDYSLSFKHGTWASHNVPLGTLYRLGYIYYRLIVLPHFLTFLLFSPAWSLIFVLSWYAKIFFSWMFLYGLISSDLIHIVLDKLSKESK